LRRFYRSDKIKHTSGLGLGLNLVAAIVKLHGFRFSILPGSGCVAEIACPHARQNQAIGLNSAADQDDRASDPLDVEPKIHVPMRRRMIATPFGTTCKSLN
jgi:hypothetical protein